MRLTSDQSHQAAAALAKERSKVCRIFGFDVFHASYAKMLTIHVNSVSLQPFFAAIGPLAVSGPIAVSRSFSENRYFALARPLEPNEANTVMVILDN